METFYFDMKRKQLNQKRRQRKHLHEEKVRKAQLF